MTEHEAMLYHPAGDGQSVVCDLCHHRCHILPGHVGICQARRCVGGERLETSVYGRCVAMSADPIEKKPLFHFLPGTSAMSMATVGCNFRCDFCQNHHISQYLSQGGGEPPGEDRSPAEIVAAACDRRCASIAYTYTEPTIFFEYAYDTARLAREQGLANCFVSNGYMTPEAVETIAPWLDAINVDLKSFRAETYRRYIGARLEGVLETIGCLHAHGIWIEITTLLIPGLNDSDDEIRDIARFIAALSADIPWHISRFYPQYHRQETPPTPPAVVLRALEIGRAEGLHHIYCGNLRDDDGESTHCHGCGSLLIARSGYAVTRNLLASDPTGACPKCGVRCAGVWKNKG